ncbi:tail assembly chaperone [Bacillus sonorensis]|uniref:tail assembly chaperone n=1 Tax=Bacillus sonorensis TaxID=119858 RepID=UPI00227F60D7|nr:tail assembly chaperone [Bacillus sonorensis]MCY8035642.1 tail assembly chaperone [Bacillus sonorensis]MCY8563703.1 tail assembly chaperone [Bacillus sonorensis]MEC1428872.1 tail assembly chaperone [Bacillus sonorensis]
MPVLEIEGKQYEARCDFKFERTAEEKYNEKDANGNKQGGLTTIYLNLLNQSSTLYLIYFWDCALSHLKAQKPSVEKIEEALEKVIDQEGEKGTERLFKEAFQAVEKSGFFIVQIKKIWKEFAILKKEIKRRDGETDEEFRKRNLDRQEGIDYAERMERLRKEMSK